MAKCDICKVQLKELFLKKIKGTIVKKPGTKKQYNICPSCQKKFPKKEQVLEQL